MTYLISKKLDLYFLPMTPIYYDESLENLESKVNKELRSLFMA